MSKSLRLLMTNEQMSDSLKKFWLKIGVINHVTLSNLKKKSFLPEASRLILKNTWQKWDRRTCSRMGLNTLGRADLAVPLLLG